MESQKRYAHKCNRCNYEWISKKNAPNTCARCRSPYWNKERIRK